MYSTDAKFLKIYENVYFVLPMEEISKLSVNNGSIFNFVIFRFCTMNFALLTFEKCLIQGHRDILIVT